MSSHRGPVRVAERHAFATVIDARSPAEYALDHIPGAVNCPVLDDDERRIVGTLYKQQGAFEARRVGGSMVAANLARHLAGPFAEQPAHWKPLVYCWRGGLRSGSMVTWMRLVGWDAQQLAGGYKSFRHHVIETLDARVPQLQLRVVVGATGSAKTRVLQALAERGAQVIDLEGLARHKGSLLGGLPGIEQPAQKHFDTLLATQIEAMDLARCVFVEGESARIGRIALPLPLVACMRAADCIEVIATPAARLAYLLRDYAYLGDAPESLSDRMAQLKEEYGRETVARWQAWAHARDLAPLFSELMAAHYDPHYQRSQRRHFARWDARLQVPADVLDDAGIGALADAVLRAAAGAPTSTALSPLNLHNDNTRNDMTDLSAFPITKKWPAQHPERLQLYSLPTPNGVKVSIMLEECGLAYEPHRVDFGANDQTTPEFLSLSPNNKIPAILDPDGPGGKPLALFESGAILIYLADKTGKFLSQDAATRYQTIQWLMFQMGGIGPMFGQLGFFHKFAGKDYEDKRPRDRYVAESKRLLGVLDKHLAGRAWIMGDDYTIADIATWGWVRNLVGFYGAGEIVGFDQFTEVKRVLDAFVARPAVQKGLNIPAAPGA